MVKRKQDGEDEDISDQSDHSGTAAAYQPVSITHTKKALVLCTIRVYSLYWISKSNESDINDSANSASMLQEETAWIRTSYYNRVYGLPHS